jgi:Protein of unknown function (DUF2510)
MDDAPGWLPDPDSDDQERYWDGAAWTDRVRPRSRLGSLHLPEHVPELQRALAAATADIDWVEDRLSVLFERVVAPDQDHDHDDDHDHDHDHDSVGDQDGAELVDAGVTFDMGSQADDEDFSELDEALATEAPARTSRGFFRRRS